MKMDCVVSDGIHYDPARDPPGLPVVYIPPGEGKEESYRLSTFRHYPRDAPVFPQDLAGAGFYYTGHRDRVKCFCCGLCVENWLMNDDVREQRWHRTDCDFTNGRATGNIPIGPSMRPPGLFNEVPVPQPMQVPNLPTEGNQNITGNNAVQDPMNLWRSSSCLSTVPKEVAAQTSNLSNFERFRLSLHCENPYNSDMQNPAKRLETFTGWHSTIRATAADLANAGFYYLGDRDRVKCWYCGGGLQNWEQDDDPWLEHAKRFPHCEFVLKKKGRAFVSLITECFPELVRPLPPLPPQAIPVQLGSQGTLDLTAILSQRTEQAMRSDVATEILGMGFSCETVKRVIQRKLARTGVGFSSATALADAILNEQDAQDAGTQDPREMGGLETNIDTCIVQAGQVTAKTVEIKNAVNVHSQCCCDQKLDHMLGVLMQGMAELKLDHHMLGVLESFKCRHRCKVCKAEAVIVFLPCGHLVACEACGRMLNECPMCGTVATGRVKNAGCGCS